MGNYKKVKQQQLFDPMLQALLGGGNCTTCSNFFYPHINPSTTGLEIWVVNHVVIPKNEDGGFPW